MDEYYAGWLAPPNPSRPTVGGHLSPHGKNPKRKRRPIHHDRDAGITKTKHCPPCRRWLIRRRVAERGRVLRRVQLVAVGAPAGWGSGGRVWTGVDGCGGGVDSPNCSPVLLFGRSSGHGICHTGPAPVHACVQVPRVAVPLLCIQALDDPIAPKVWTGVDGC